MHARRFVLLLIPLLLPMSACAQIRMRDPAVGRFLVASRDLPDPNFAETVVLLCEYGESGTMGLIVNRRTDVPLSRALKEFDEAKGRTDLAYAGGPVQRNAVLALVRSRYAPDDTRRVLDDVWLANTKDLLAKALHDDPKGARIRVYFGYAGWGKGQLERELEMGAWHIFPGDAETVFHSDPDSVWPRLIRRTELQVARAAPQPKSFAPHLMGRSASAD